MFKRKIAVLYSGNIEAFQKCYSNHKLFIDYLINKFSTVDVFYGCYDDDLYKYTINHKNNYIYFIDKIIISRPEFQNNEINNYDLEKSFQEGYEYLYLLKHNYENVLKYQNDNNIYYEYIIHIDYSCHIHFNELFLNQNMTTVNGQLKGNLFKNNFINLNLVYGKQDMMKYFYNSIDYKIIKQFNIYDHIVDWLRLNKINIQLDETIRAEKVIYQMIDKQIIHKKLEIFIIKSFVFYLINFWDYRFKLTTDKDVIYNYKLYEFKLIDKSLTLYEMLDLMLYNTIIYLFVNFSINDYIIYINSHLIDINQFKNCFDLKYIGIKIEFKQLGTNCNDKYYRKLSYLRDLTLHKTI